MRQTLAQLLGKTIFLVTRTLKKGGGSAAPGFYALKTDPNLVEKLIQKVPKNIIITGTNGKTTTARMLTLMAEHAGLKVIRNSTGSNLERGIASALISNLRLSGLPAGRQGVNLNFDLGIWEVDEAAFNTVAPKIKPDLTVFLNAFRDQLDRYGEVDTVIKKWAETLIKLPQDKTILINADDYGLLKLKNSYKGRVEFYSVEGAKISGEKKTKSPKKLKIRFKAKNISVDGLLKTDFDYWLDSCKIPVKLSMSGLYNVYNAAAAISALFLTRDLTDTDVKVLEKFQPAFGRMEKLDFGFIFLIKNPVGTTEVLKTIVPQLKKEDRLLVVLNDNSADGTDISWIWDSEFELLTINNKQLTIACSGTRAFDLGLRLKYAGFNPNHLTVEPDIKKAFIISKKNLKGRLFVLPTYTALLELQKILAQSRTKKYYWEEI